MLDISRLSYEDLDAALRLSTQAGWNQVVADWERFLALAPEGCFGGYADGDLVATTCVMTYDSAVSWIGMVLVDEAHRHQGYGTAMFNRGLTYALMNDSSDIGLDATDLGAPLYHDQGLRSTATVERWVGTLTQASSHKSVYDVYSLTDVDALATLDRRVLGIDRRELLTRLCAEDGVTALVVGDSVDPVGYAIVRPGRIHPQIGPILAPDATTVSSLLNGVVSTCSDTAVIVDTVAKERTSTLLRDHGLERRRELSRMSYESTEPLLTSNQVWAIVDFAWG
jgi:GNAT superfamily N-acetyltransferase